MKIAVSLLFLVSACSGFFSGSSKRWDDLRVTWGVNPFSSFRSQPKTVDEAKRNSFTLVGPEVCGETSKYNGIAYVKNNDYSLILLFDIKGNIAGIQTAVSQKVAQEKNYPSSHIIPPFTTDGIDNERYVLTAYFTDPGKICTEGNDVNPFDDPNAADLLWLQTGSSPADVTVIPKKESDVQAPWVDGKCFYSMGKHYWYNVSPKMDCDTFFPVFLLYNDGELNAFGWALGADLDSPNYEHPPQKSFSAFMKEVPECLANIGPLSTMHIFLTSTPRRNFC